MQIRLLAIFAFVIFMLSCSEKSNEPIIETQEYFENSSLVILVENNDGLLSENALAEQYKAYLLPVISNIFEIPVESMQDMSINEIVEVYGEDWQIETITKAGEGHYGRIEALSDEELTKQNFIDLLEELTAEGRTIDLVFCLHGSKNSFFLNDDEEIPVKDFCDELESRNIAVRSLYQTCCYSNYTRPTWESYGIKALNSATGLNYITMFSPAYFLENWTDGMKFDEAVHQAYKMELEKLKSLDDTELPVLEYFLSEESLKGSKQICGGKNYKIKWYEYMLAL